MIGNTVSHYRIIGRLGEGRRGSYLSRPRWGSFRQVAIKALPNVSVSDTEQLAHIKRQAEFLLQKELKRE